MKIEKQSVSSGKIHQFQSKKLQKFPELNFMERWVRRHGHTSLDAHYSSMARRA